MSLKISDYVDIRLNLFDLFNIEIDEKIRKIQDRLRRFIN